ESVKHPDGLTVLAFFYELDRHQHPAYDDIVSALGNVTDPHTTVIMSHPFSFLNILPYDLKRYFTYRGSLTTPPCSEVIEAFRELRSANGKITHNFRPIQPLGDRVVFYNIDNSYYNYNEIDEPEEAATAKPTRRKKGHRSPGNVPQANLLLTFSFLL
ncbi:Carbonic anhydrase, partial [Operophtera brumata]